MATPTSVTQVTPRRVPAWPVKTSPGGLDPDLLATLAPGAIGAQVTVFDPDLDPDGSYARPITDILLNGHNAAHERCPARLIMLNM
jgi:hypothetical protein